MGSGSFSPGTYTAVFHRPAIRPPYKMRDGRAFVWMDRYLDTTCHGPLYLREARIARIVATSLHKGSELGHYDLGAYVVMSNHVHVLLFPRVPPPRLMRALKGATARAANVALARTGLPFWQAESYDHWVRDQHELERITAYIENNPVKAGLVARPEDHPWSSAADPSPSTGTSPGAAGTSA